MDELISNFIDMKYTLELGYELQRSLQIFDYFEYRDPYPNIENLIMTCDDKDTAEVADQVAKVIKDGIDYLYKAHSITLADDVPLDKRNELLLAICIYMKLDDYTVPLTILYSDREDMEKFSDIFTDICTLSEIDIYDMIEDIDPSFFSIMKEYAEGKSEDEQYNLTGRHSTDCVESIRLFKELYGDAAIGVQMATAGTLLGSAFTTYLGYVRNELIDPNDIKKTGLNILSVLLLSSNGNNAPLVTYKKYIDSITDNMDLVQKLEATIIGLYSEFENYKRAVHEKARVS